MFAMVAVSLARREVASPPLEISIFEGPKDPASPPPGEKSTAPGPVAAAGNEVKRVEAPKAPPASKVVRQPVARPRAVAKPAPVERAVQAQAKLATPKPNEPAPTTAYEGSESSARLQQAPLDGAGATGTTLGAARSQADGSTSAEVRPSAPAVAAGADSGVGSSVLPGPGGSGSGWNSGVRGNGSGGFSITGAGAGGAGRSYASIWEWTRRYLPGLRWAYDNELRSHAALRGVILVRYEILASGAVGDVTMVSSEIHDPHLEQQVLQQIRGWHYPPEPSGTVVVTWPFSFLPPR
jgi:TonB family protein